MNKDEILQEIKDKLLSEGDLRQLVGELNSYNSSLSDLDYWENGEDFFRTFYDNDIDGAVRAVCYGDYTYTDEYVIINAYGNLDSISEYDLDNLLEDSIDEIVDALVDVWNEDTDYTLPEGVAELLDQYVEGGE